ncbi:UNVERIFIED_ORG: crotonobetainyl-CoA:carnitine CoA-transferase CaiB-like acyl-CoA transferase [Rhizobium aethiopicum]
MADGYLILAVGNDGQFRRLCTILGLETMSGDERFSTNKARIANRGEVRRLVSTETLKWQKADLLKACEENAVPAGAINTIEEMFADPQIEARGLRIDLADAAGTVIPGVRTPVVLSETPLSYSRPSPRLGEHTEEILAELAERERKASS